MPAARTLCYKITKSIAIDTELSSLYLRRHLHTSSLGTCEGRSLPAKANGRADAPRPVSTPWLLTSRTRPEALRFHSCLGERRTTSSIRGGCSTSSDSRKVDATKTTQIDPDMAGVVRIGVMY